MNIKNYYFNGTNSSKYKHDLPFEILNFNKNMFTENENVTELKLIFCLKIF